MEKQFVTTSDHPRITFVVDGNLSLKGSDENQVIAKASSPEDLSVEQKEEDIRIRCTSDCRAIVPANATIIVETVHGDAAVKALEGDLSLENIHGSLSLRYTGPARIEHVHGELKAKHIGGDFLVERVDGNATIRDVEGMFTVEEKINGNLSLDDVERGASAEVDGNITLRLDPFPGAKYEFRAGGNLICRLPSDTSAQIVVAKASALKVDLGDTRLNEREHFPFEFKVGDGEASMSFEAGGNILLTGRAPDWEMADEFDADFEAEFTGMAEEISQQVTQQVEAQMEMLENQLESQMENLSATLSGIGMSPEQAERISQKAREASSRAAARAQEKMRQAQEKMQRKLEAAQRKAEQRARQMERMAQHHERRSWGFSWPAASPEQPAEPVNPEEQILILKMLEEKKITPEEAEKLLAALEGKQ